MLTSDITEFLQEKLAKAEMALRAREEAASTWRGGTDAEWREADQVYPSTRHLPPITKAERLAEADREDRIAEKCRRDIEMFQAAIAILDRLPDSWASEDQEA